MSILSEDIGWNGYTYHVGPAHGGGKPATLSCNAYGTCIIQSADGGFDFEARVVPMAVSSVVETASGAPRVVYWNRLHAEYDFGQYAFTAPLSTLNVIAIEVMGIDDE